MKIKFTKMHGAGNDYIYVNTMLYPIEHPEEAAIRWSRPHTGIGSDGLVLIGTSEKADFSMRIFNADGSEAKMCGNASRCIGKYLYEYGLTDRTDITLNTLSGVKHLQLQVGPAHTVQSVTVDMGIPDSIHPVELGDGFTPYTEGMAVSMGNPHLVIFVDDVMQADLPAIGPRLERHPLFPDRGQRRICPSHRRRTHPHESVGTRLGHHTGLRHGSLCHGRRSRRHRTMRTRRRRRHGRRYALPALAQKRRTHAHDRAGHEGLRRGNRTLTQRHKL